MGSVITGTPKSGTKSLSWLLRNCGLESKHETAYRFQEPWSPLTEFEWIEVSWVGALHAKKVDVPVIHLVRDPLDCVRSLACQAWSSSKVLGWLNKRISGDLSRLDWSLRLWTIWNSLIEEANPCFRIRREEIDLSVIKKIARISGQPLDEDQASKAMRLTPPKEVIHHAWDPMGYLDRRLAWEDFESPEVKSAGMDMATRYGYTEGI